MPLLLINRVNSEAARSAIRIQHVKECERGEEFPSLYFPNAPVRKESFLGSRACSAGQSIHSSRRTTRQNPIATSECSPESFQTEEISRVTTHF